jgi:nitrate/nitrite transporter NarK
VYSALFGEVQSLIIDSDARICRGPICFRKLEPNQSDVAVQVQTSMLCENPCVTPPAAHESIAAPMSGRQAGSALNLNVVLLSLSYMSEGYLLFMFVSWIYIYLVEVRGFSLARGGVVASLPWIAAIITTPLGGILSDQLSLRFGSVQSARILIMTGYMLSGMLLLAAARAHSRLSAVLVLGVSLASLYLAESSFWTTATVIAGNSPGVVTGFMNTIGIFGGIVSNALVPALPKHYVQKGWIMAFGSGTGMGALCAALWWILGKRLNDAKLQTNVEPRSVR